VQHDTRKHGVLARMRSKFFVKDTDPVGLRGLSIARPKRRRWKRTGTVEIAPPPSTRSGERGGFTFGIDWSYSNSSTKRRCFLTITTRLITARRCPHGRSLDGERESDRLERCGSRLYGAQVPLADDLCAKIDQGGFGLSIGFIPMRDWRTQSRKS